MRQFIAAVLSLVLLLPTRAVAHQQLLRAAPEEGASLAHAPQEIRLTFNQAVEPALARFRLDGPLGEVTLAAIKVPPDSAKVMVARITGRLVPGAYTVHWRVTGADGHPVRGEYRFTIQRDAAGVAPDPMAAGTVAPDPGPAAPGLEAPPVEHHVSGASGSGFDAGSPLYAAVRWLTFTGLLVVIGAVSFSLVLLSALRRREPALQAEVLSRARARAASVGIIAGTALSIALVLRLLTQSAALHGSGAAWSGELVGVMLTRTLWGWGWILQAVATGILLMGLWLARGGRRGGWGLAAISTVALAMTPALSGHAAATSSVAVIADTLHVLAAGGWLGTLLLLMLVGLPVLFRAAGSRTTAAASLLSAFSPLALAYAGVLTLTGIYAASVHLPGVAELWSSAYGQTLLAKLAALSVVFGTGAYNWLRARPALEKRGNLKPLRRSATAELVMGVVVLAVTAALVATPPPGEGGSLATRTERSPSAQPVPESMP